MDTIAVMVGFACIAGILAGYIAGSRGPGWSLLLLWVVCGLVAGGYAMWLNADEGPVGSLGPSFLYGVVIAFGLSSVPAGCLGFVRRMVQRQGAQDGS